MRDVDVSGVSGRGVIVWGIEWPDGRVSYRWNTATATSTVADSIQDVEAVHGHNGATRLHWVDSERDAQRWRRYVHIGDGPPPVWRGRGAAAEAETSDVGTAG